MYVAPGFQGHELKMDVAVSSCDTHRPVGVYPSPCHFSTLICLSLSGSFRPCLLSAFISLKLPVSLSLVPARPIAMLIRMPGKCSVVHVCVCVCVCVWVWGGGSPVTKLSDEACDLFKGMPESQHQSELGHKMTQLDTETSVCVNVWVCMHNSQFA